jgi:hypothetical protein
MAGTRLRTTGIVERARSGRKAGCARLAKHDVARAVRSSRRRQRAAPTFASSQAIRSAMTSALLVSLTIS